MTVNFHGFKITLQFSQFNPDDSEFTFKAVEIEGEGDEEFYDAVVKAAADQEAEARRYM